MDGMTCEDVRERLMLGENDGVGRHLESCEPCRQEAAVLRGLTETLGASREVVPPAALDAAIRAAFRGPAGAWSPLRHPHAAVALAVGALIAILSAVTAWLVETPLGENSLAVALPAVIGYLGLCSAAMLPVLLRHRRRVHLQEVNG
ncbi:MAG: hypothetical protein R3344_03710 [Acidobacteriota bacterium]|nr:hypothetical protein [Acidobacteriota bacterium]